MQGRYFYRLKNEIMKTTIMNIRFDFLGYLLFLPFLLFCSCQESIEEISLDAEVVINQDSKIVTLMKSAVKSDDDDDQCIKFKYPLGFYVYYTGSISIETVIINNDDELIAFFDELSNTDQLNFDFPIELIDTDGEVTPIDNLDELVGTLQVAVDACRGEVDYDFCDDKNKKVYICHKGQTICVSINAIWGHINNHEDDGDDD